MCLKFKVPTICPNPLPLLHHEDTNLVGEGDNFIFCQYFLKNTKQLKKFWSVGGAHQKRFYVDPLLNWFTGRERLIRSHSSARFCFELSGNSN